MSLIKDQFNKNKKQFIAAGVVVLILVVAGLSYWWTARRSHTYYAIFMTNNQVYFGSISDKDGKYIMLKNAAYLQNTDPSKPQQVAMVQRGGELHSPTGDMNINRDQVLFIEELTPNSQVTKSIEAYRTSQGK